jgi:type IV pilus assembly protein PilN
MARINLLPWRDARREERKKQYLTILGLTVVFAGGLLFLADRIVNGQIETQNARNNYLTQNIRELDKQVQEIKDLQKRRNQLIDRMRVIQELQGNRPIIVFYTNVSSREQELNIQGVAESNNRVSSLMRRLDASDWLKEPNLDAVRAAPNFGDQANNFNLKVKVDLPSKDDEEG